MHSIIIKLLPCLVLTVISFILIRVLCQAAKRKVKLKGYNQPTATTTTANIGGGMGTGGGGVGGTAVNASTALNGHRYCCYNEIIIHFVDNSIFDSLKCLSNNKETTILCIIYI